MIYIINILKFEGHRTEDGGKKKAQRQGKKGTKAEGYKAEDPSASLRTSN